LFLPLSIALKNLETISDNEIVSIINIYFGFGLLCVSLYVNFISPDYFRRTRYPRQVKRFASGNFRIFLLIGALVFVGAEYFGGIFNTISQKTVVYVLIQLSLSLMYMSLANRLIRRMSRWRAPELTLVRGLANAFKIVAEGSLAKWRSISRRSEAARNIEIAAAALEGPIARKFLTSAGHSGAAAIQERFMMAGAALRGKVAWLATPTPETREHLARALATQLLIAATGELDRLECVELKAVSAPSVGWLARLRATAGWAIFGFGPGVFVVVGKWAGWITDAATTGILVQFAGLCFFVAVLSATDPTGYKERLGSVTGTGAALFGWKKPEKPEKTENKD
jgi:hypothetical protein